MAKSLQAKTIHCQLAGTSARARDMERGVSWAGAGLCGQAEEGEAGAGRRRRAAVGWEGEREGGRDSVTLPKGVCAVRTRG